MGNVNMSRLVTLGFLAICPTAYSQDYFSADYGPRLQKVLKETTIHLEGSEDPDKIPFYLKMFWVLHVLEDPSTMSAAGLSASDAKTLARAAQLEHVERDVDFALYVSSLTPECGNIEDRDASDLALAAVAAADTAIGRQQERYKRILAALSDAGRGTIEKLISEKIAPGISYSTNDQVSFALKEPALFKDSIRGACEVYLRGAPPLPPSLANTPEEAAPRSRTLSASSDPTMVFGVN
jgi:hypothetical protein